MLLGSTGVAALGQRCSPRVAAGVGLAVIGMGVTLLATAQSAAALWSFALVMGVGTGVTNTALPTRSSGPREPDGVPRALPGPFAGCAELHVESHLLQPFRERRVRLDRPDRQHPTGA